MSSIVGRTSKILALSVTLHFLLAASVVARSSTTPAPETPDCDPNIVRTSNLQVLSDTMGVDFGAYLSDVIQKVRHNWFAFIPESATWKKGVASIRFDILQDGNVSGARLACSAGDAALDRAAWGGVTASNPFPPLPTEFRGPHLALRFTFFYNPSPEQAKKIYTSSTATSMATSIATSSNPSNAHVWWKEAVVYQIYPRSFKDSNGDGIGDLRGIISKLDYLQSLGVDVIWLNPIYGSPNDDNGYDISDYRGIMKEFGTMKDFDELLACMHARHMKLVMDLVVNHSSDEHPWFQRSRSSRDNPYRDYYHWWPAEKGKPAARWSFFDVNGDAWKFDEKTNSYYLHYFSQKQPDLNWENPKVREEIFSMMCFWFDKGIDGFRMDVIPFISKDTSFPPLPAEYHGNYIRYYANGPYTHQYLQQMNKEVLSKYDVMTVAEGIGVTTEDIHNYVNADRHELNMAYHFDGVSLGYLPNSHKIPDPKGWSLIDFKDIYTKWDTALSTEGWGTIYLGNHDQPRMVTRWGNDSPEWRELSSKMLTTFLLTMRATPYYYAGDELGMTNIKFDSIDDYQDIETRNWYTLEKNEGRDTQAFLNAAKISARDNGRTPFQWDATANAGFTTGKPWLKVNPNYKEVNVAKENADPNSCLNYFRQLVKLRKANPVLIYGAYTLLDRANPDVYAYARELDGKKLLVMLNFKDHPATANTGLDLTKAKVLAGNYPTPATDGKLRGYEAVIYEW